jgi:TolB protein
MAGAGRVLVFLNWSTALAALGTLVFAADRGGRGTRIAAAVAAALCAVVAWPGVVSQADLDAKWVNAVAPVGVAVAFVLSVRGARPIAFGSWSRADRWRLALGLPLVLLSLPWILAAMGLGTGSIPGLRSAFYAQQVWAPLGQPRLHHAVHPGEHHGLDGMLLALTVLLLSRRIGDLRGPRLRQAARLYCAAMLAYGLANVLNDAWFEQLVKRGTLDWSLPSMIVPAPTLAWAILLAAVAVLYLLVLRQGERTDAVTLSPAWALVFLPALVVGLVVGLTHHEPHSAVTPPAGLARARLAFASQAGSADRIFAISGDGSGLVRLTDGPRGDAAPDWSPDGRTIVFQSGRDGNQELYAVNADGSGVRRLTRDDAADGEPAWSPDGRRIAFVSDRGGDDDLYVMDRDGSRVRRVTHGLHTEWPSWSPDGAAIAFSGERGGTFDLYSVAADGATRVRRVTSGPADDRYPRFFPGGGLVFESDRGGAFGLYTLAAAERGLPVRRLGSGGGHDFDPAVSRDGRWVAFVSDRDGLDQLFVVRRDGTALARLTSGRADRGAASWAP